MTEPSLRDSYLRWFRAATPALALPLALTALMQWASSSAWWSTGPPPAGAARYLFLSIAVAAVVVGRNVRRNETETLPLEREALRALSWKLVTYALSPVTIGALLAFMTRQVLDFYAMLLVTLVGIGLLFPRFDQWAAWAAPAPEAP